jgi:hypothetical protein
LLQRWFYWDVTATVRTIHRDVAASHFFYGNVATKVLHLGQTLTVSIDFLLRISAPYSLCVCGVCVCVYVCARACAACAMVCACARAPRVWQAAREEERAAKEAEESAEQAKADAEKDAAERGRRARKAFSKQCKKTGAVSNGGGGADGGAGGGAFGFSATSLWSVFAPVPVWFKRETFGAS